MKDFYSGAGIVAYIVMQYGCAILATILCMAVTEWQYRYFSHCVLVAVLMTYLQRQVPSRAAVVRFTTVFMLFLTSACYILATFWFLPEVAKYVAKWL